MKNLHNLAHNLAAMQAIIDARIAHNLALVRFFSTGTIAELQTKFNNIGCGLAIFGTITAESRAQLINGAKSDLKDYLDYKTCIGKVLQSNGLTQQVQLDALRESLRFALFDENAIVDGFVPTIVNLLKQDKTKNKLQRVTALQQIKENLADFYEVDCYYKLLEILAEHISEEQIIIEKLLVLREVSDKTVYLKSSPPIQAMQAILQECLKTSYALAEIDQNQERHLQLMQTLTKVSADIQQIQDEMLKSDSSDHQSYYKKMHRLLRIKSYLTTKLEYLNEQISIAQAKVKLTTKIRAMVINLAKSAVAVSETARVERQRQVVLQLTQQEEMQAIMRSMVSSLVNQIVDGSTANKLMLEPQAEVKQLEPTAAESMPSPAAVKKKLTSSHQPVAINVPLTWRLRRLDSIARLLHREILLAYKRAGATAVALQNYSMEDCTLLIATQNNLAEDLVQRVCAGLIIRCIRLFANEREALTFVREKTEKLRILIRQCKSPGFSYTFQFEHLLKNVRQDIDLGKLFLLCHNSKLNKRYDEVMATALLSGRIKVIQNRQYLHPELCLIGELERTPFAHLGFASTADGHLVAYQYIGVNILSCGKCNVLIHGEEIEEDAKPRFEYYSAKKIRSVNHLRGFNYKPRLYIKAEDSPIPIAIKSSTKYLPAAPFVVFTRGHFASGYPDMSIPAWALERNAAPIKFIHGRLNALVPPSRECTQHALFQEQNPDLSDSDDDEDSREFPPTRSLKL